MLDLPDHNKVLIVKFKLVEDLKTKTLPVVIYTIIHSSNRAQIIKIQRGFYPICEYVFVLLIVYQLNKQADKIQDSSDIYRGPGHIYICYIYKTMKQQSKDQNKTRVARSVSK